MKKWGNDTWRAGAILLLCLFLFASAAWAETDVTTMVKINPGRLLYDRLTKQSYLDVSVTNISTDVLLTPIKVVIDSVSPSTVTVANADGVTAEGKPYFEYTTATNQLLPATTSAAKKWSFANPAATRFTYVTHVVATLPDAAAVIESAGGTLETPDGIALDIPTGSLDAPATISVAAVPEEVIAAESAIDNSRLLSAATFGPSGLTFENPVSITFPLSSVYEPGTNLPLYIYDEDVKGFVDSGFTCAVEDDGASCVAEVTHFCTYAPVENSLMPHKWQFGNHHMFDTKTGDYLGEYAYFIPDPYLGIVGFRLPNSKRDTPPTEIFTFSLPTGVTQGGVQTTTRTAAKEIAAKLFSSVRDEDIANHYGKEPVLFIHGYQLKNNFGGGETYWGKFPFLIENLNLDGRRFIPFDFQWRTNARFQDVAEDLFYAVNAIYQKTGNKKVHIVAHSFGGILTRVMLQKYFPVGVLLSADSLVASVTTIGTPHSGIADNAQSMYGMDFPQGQDSWAHEGAGQISVFQMGEPMPVTLDDELCQSFELDCSPGEIAKAINDFENGNFLPANLPFQVAIGLTGALNWNNTALELGTGDKLIRYEGQRFHPLLTVNGIKNLVTGQNDFEGITPKGFITETLLGLEGDDLRPDYTTEDIDAFKENYPNFGDYTGVFKGLGYKHSAGTPTLAEYLFSENVVECGSAATCNHASFLAVKDWLARYSDGVPVHFFNLKVSVVDELLAPVNGAEIHVYANGVSVNVVGVTAYDGTAVLAVPFSANTHYTLEVSHDEYATALADNCFMTGETLDSPLYHFGLVHLSIPEAPIVLAPRLPDTGQTVCYDNSTSIPCPKPGELFYGQDANYLINPPAYTDHGNGTVTDNVTGLMWQQGDNGYTNWYKASGTVDSSYNPTGVDVCGDLTLAGYTDWRLPTKKELVGLVDYSRPYPGPTINTTYFPNTKQSPYWSSSTLAHHPYYAWYVGFYDGGVHGNKASSNYVRCVRDGQ